MEEELAHNRIRHLILKHLYEKRKTARGLVSLRSNITEIKTALKKLGIIQSQVVQNMEYLIEHDWVKEEVEQRSYITPDGREVLSERRSYKLTENGQSHFELCEAEKLSDELEGIDLSKVEGLIVEERHIIRREFVDFFDKLDRLEDSVKTSRALSDEDKLLARSDIQTIMDQLAKRTPDKDIIREALTDIQWMGTSSGFIENYSAVQYAARQIYEGKQEQ